MDVKKTKPLIFIAIVRFLPLAMAATLIALLVYGAAQFVIRSGANDPQVEIAHSVGIALDSGLSHTLFDKEVSKRTDMEKSLEPFVIIYDKKGTSIASGAVLEGVARTPPSGVFETASQKGSYRVTWQPNDTVRIATIIVPFKDGYVLAGRSLKEAESRLRTLTIDIFFAWLVILAATFCTSCISTYMERKNMTDVNTG